LNAHRLILTSALVALLVIPALAAPQSIDLVHMRRHYFTNTDWSTDHARLGGQEILGSLVGLGGSNDSTIVYEIAGKFDMLETLVGYLDSAPSNRSAVFEVWADGVLLQRMGPLLSGGPPELMRVPLKGRKMLTLRIVPQRYDSTHGAAWGNPKLWSNLGDQIPGSLLMTVNGRSMQTVPNSYKGQQEVLIPIPLHPGSREYRVKTEYEPTSGRVRIQTGDVPAEKQTEEIPVEKQ
jgi:hypothetical protein